ncbi:MAG: CehA/McbA family metallohydrolase [Vicinamibacterales bacterium]
MRRLLVILIVIAAAVYAAAPPGAPVLPPPPHAIAAPVRGAIHVHTRRSDGGSTIAEVARSAARAGLQFVILTDHGDGTRPPDPPAYLDGVLVIDAVEISTDGGHVVALGLSGAPYPLAGEARDVVEDVHRLGGFAIAGHPASPKTDLRWSDWTVPIDGFEHLNGDSEWRDEFPWRLARALIAYPVRPAEALALLFDRADEVLRRWDAATRDRRVVAVAGADAHARLGLAGGDEPNRDRVALPVPSYDAVFRAFSIALPQATLTSDPRVDGPAVVEEIRQGRVFSSVDALGSRPSFSFTAASGPFRAVGGEALALQGPVRVEVAVQAPPDVQIGLVRDGRQLLDARGPALQYDADAAPAVFRVEVKMPGAPGEPPVPWIVSNPIYVGRATGEGPPERTRNQATARTDLYTDGPAPEWTVERSASSQGAVDVVKSVGGTQILFRYAIAGTASSHPFAALVVPAGGTLPGHDRLTFRARSDRPMRLSVQVRAPGASPDGERWHRSVFVDTVPREIAVFFDDMRPRGPTSAPRPPLERAQSVLFVVDTINTPAGTAGQVSLDDVRYER